MADTGRRREDCQACNSEGGWDRLVFMNRWVVDEGADGRSYMEDFLDRLQEAVAARRE